MKITRNELRRIISEQLNVHQYSKFNPVYNSNNNNKSGAGILSWVDKNIASDFGGIRGIASWLNKELYESLRNSTSEMSTSPTLNSIDNKKDMEYFNYYNGQSSQFLTDVAPHVSNMSSIEFRFDGSEREFIQWTAKKSGALSRDEANASSGSNSSSKVYYTIGLKDPQNQNFDINAFIEEFKRVMKNIAVQLVSICNKTGIDRLSFKTWSNLAYLLKTQDNIVIYTDNQDESMAVKTQIDRMLNKLNGVLSVIKVLNSSERQTQLNRVVIGTDLSKSANGVGQSDTSMLAYVMTAALLNNNTILDEIKRLLRKLQNDRDIDSFLKNFNLQFGPAMKSVTNKWINFSSNDKINAYRRAANLLG